LLRVERPRSPSLCCVARRRYDRATMNLSVLASLVILGVIVGVVSGMLGIGGAIMIIPALIFFYGLDQKHANGTSLAVLLPPIALFAVIEYHQAGFIKWPIAIALMVGFMAGAPLGAKLVTSDWISERTLRLWFGFFLAYVSARLLFRPGTVARAGLYTFLMMLGFAVVWQGARMFGMRMGKAPYWPKVYRDQLARPPEHDYEI
jgi:uncharacterized protein